MKRKLEKKTKGDTKKETAEKIEDAEKEETAEKNISCPACGMMSYHPRQFFRTPDNGAQKTTQNHNVENPHQFNQ